MLLYKDESNKLEIINDTLFVYTSGRLQHVLNRLSHNYHLTYVGNDVKFINHYVDKVVLTFSSKDRNYVASETLEKYKEYIKRKVINKTIREGTE